MVQMNSRFRLLLLQRRIKRTAFEYTYTCIRSWLHPGSVPIATPLVSPFEPELVIGPLAQFTRPPCPPHSHPGKGLRFE